MKKVMLSLILLFLALFINAKVSAASWSYRWENTEVKIPIGASINNYSNIPKAYLYKDNVLLDDAKINIITEGDWLYYLSDVNTKKIGTYEVWYKAFENDKYKPGTCNGYKCKISFIVYDDIPPVLDIISNDIKIRQGSEFNPLGNIIVNDNYDDEVELGYTTDLDLNKNGTYKINVYAIDSSFNKSEISYNVIVDSNPPIIKYNNKEINIPLNGSLDINAYFEGYDEILGDVTSYIEYGEYDENTNTLLPLDTSSLGQRELTLRLSIQNHSVTKKYIANIIDDVPPVMSFNDKDLNEGITLDYNLGYEDYDFLKHVKITDNVEINYNNLTYSTNCEKRVGSYTVWYYYNDSKFNVSGSLVVNLISYDSPVIEVRNITTYQDEEVDYYDYFTVTDESDPNISSKIIVDDSNVDLSTPGVYNVEIYAINSSGRSTTKKIKLEVLDKEIEAAKDSNDDTKANSSNTDSSSSSSKSDTAIFSADTFDNLKSDSIYLFIIIALVGLVVFLLIKSKRKKINN